MIVIDFLLDGQDNTARVYGGDMEDFFKERSLAFAMVPGGYEVVFDEDLEEAQRLKEEVEERFTIDVEIREE